MNTLRCTLCFFLLAVPFGLQSAYAQYPLPEDVASPEALAEATYEVIQRPPGENYQWERSKSLFLPYALEIPNTEQNGGVFSVFTPEQFQRIVDSFTIIGGPNDKGFQEEQTHAVVHQYGDIAQVFSTYQKHYWDSDQILARGLNSFQMVRRDGQWQVVSIVWDEDYAGGPIPEQYGGTAPNTTHEPLPGPKDFSSPQAIVTAAYEAIQRAPGEEYDWTRFRSLFLPQATLIPNTEQTGGTFVVNTPGQFSAMVDSLTVVGGPDDKGFAEEEIHSIVHQYGDVAQVFSTYQKRFWGDDQILGRGINSFQLVRHDGRWWIVGIAWDEETGAGPIPAEYGGQ